jgi:hypothetical protein
MPKGQRRRYWAGWAVLALAPAAACRSYVPARFAARPAITDARDQNPVPMPSVRSVPEPAYLAEVYLHRPLREAFSLTTYPQAKDCNALDEVPRSSWFVPRAIDTGASARASEGPGGPQPPYVILPDEPLALASAGLVIRDAHGQRYEFAIDPPDRPEMRTGALAVAARLVWALGLETPQVVMARVRLDDFRVGEGAKTDALSRLQAEAPPVDDRYRVAALAWPEGKHLGRSPETGTRDDDPNDVIAHEDRRTLRALRVFASWLALAALGPQKTLDRYVGAPGQGHVVHYLVGLDDALGAGNVVRATDPPPELAGGSPFIRLISLGLARSAPRPPTRLDVPAVGGLTDDVDPERFNLPMPYSPADRLQASDGYWAAKRIGLLTRTSGSAHLARAIDAGEYSDPRARQRIRRALEARGRAVAGYWFARVVPVEFVSMSGADFDLRDEAVAFGLVSPGVTDYRFDFVSSDARPVAQPLWVHPRGGAIHIELPDAALRAASDYLIVRLVARRAGRWLPRAVEFHIRPLGKRPAVVGIRH